jgi:two-component system alkaline phosphatase synthesis response regulator PhoP
MTESARTSTSAQKVVIVNGDDQILELLQTVLVSGRYDVVFVESTNHAYSQVKSVKPNLVILCVHIDDLEGFQVLSMLKMDEETRKIPVLTYTTEFEDPDFHHEIPEDISDQTMYAPETIVWMN